MAFPAFVAALVGQGPCLPEVVAVDQRLSEMDVVGAEVGLRCPESYGVGVVGASARRLGTSVALDLAALLWLDLVASAASAAALDTGAKRW